eukprot:CAMPEP_0175059234 /NCGR_PEP_ID=MMETSP0052_2-20121109/12316_1 /TAXON_ID=51329 ORGANISM="Polytomella parva, Strain SAG 63-3" /NCGR_SAMPLE_ID=MMETSP0052_2 /ASSEMBLY_ACC=CAM_ASM_000194 /LENGTH=111 /DNA_ID=CAMNT_0016324755 /DNA_START=219 /DNA_END=552 /DNA_ORIENTATION=-
MPLSHLAAVSAPTSERLAMESLASMTANADSIRRTMEQKSDALNRILAEIESRSYGTNASRGGNGAIDSTALRAEEQEATLQRWKEEEERENERENEKEKENEREKEKEKE